MAQSVLKAFKQLIQWRCLTIKFRYYLEISLIWSSVFPVIPSSTFLHRTQSHFFSKRNPLYSHEPVKYPVYHLISVSVHLSFHFSLRTHHMGTYLVFTFQRPSNNNNNDLLLLLYLGHCKVNVKYMLVIGRETFLLLFFRVKICNPLGVLFICI